MPKKGNIKKFVMLSSMGADKPEKSNAIARLFSKTQCRWIFKNMV
jgi:glycine cleavage system regulatory protein